MNIDAEIAAASARCKARTDELADRMLASQKFAFAHDRRSRGQIERQIRARIGRIFADAANRLILIKWRYSDDHHVSR